MVLKHKIDKSSDIVLRKIGDEYLLVPVTNVIDTDYVLRLNEVGAHIWKAMNHTKSYEKIIELLKQKYGTAYEIEKDLIEFLEKMEKLRLITIEDL